MYIQFSFTFSSSWLAWSVHQIFVAWLFRKASWIQSPGSSLLEFPRRQGFRKFRQSCNVMCLIIEKLFLSFLVGISYILRFSTNPPFWICKFFFLSQNNMIFARLWTETLVWFEWLTLGFWRPPFWKKNPSFFWQSGKKVCLLNSISARFPRLCIHCYVNKS